MRTATSIQEIVVTSADGTSISATVSGAGPAIVLVAAALSSRSDTKRLAARLAGDFTVVNYDRRGRGLSDGTRPYAVDREIDDIEALVDRVGGRVALFGSSSGAVLSLDAAERLGAKISSVALFEPPFILDSSRPPVGPDFTAQLEDLLRVGDHDGAVRLFFTQALGMPRATVVIMRLLPGWRKMTAMAPTLRHDLAVMGDTQLGRPLPAQRWTNVAQPALVVTGEKSEPFFHDSADALVALLPDARHDRLANASHSAVVASPKRVAELIQAFVMPSG